MEKISVKSLFDVQAHIGHMRKYRHPTVKGYLYKTHNRQDIIDLEFTVKQINQAKEFLKKFKLEDVLFVGNLNVNNIKLNKCKKWKSGMITNFKYSELSNMPKLIVFESVNESSVAIKEARKFNIQLIGILDTNTNVSVDLIDYPIVMNDDNLSANELVLNYLFAN